IRWGGWRPALPGVRGLLRGPVAERPTAGAASRVEGEADDREWIPQLLPPGDTTAHDGASARPGGHAAQRSWIGGVSGAARAELAPSGAGHPVRTGCPGT